MNESKQRQELSSSSVQYNGDDPKYVESVSSMPLRYLGIPLVDDDLAGDETFVVISKRFGKLIVYRFSQEKSLYLFSPRCSLRQNMIYLATSQYFEVFILVLIVINCILLTFKNPPEEVEYLFAGLYTMEMVVKIIAKGFCLHKFAYLRDPWNWLDFIVVNLGYLTMAPSVANLSGIRTFRVLRALRTISVVEGLRTMVNAFLRSMRMLTDVLILSLFFISIFALIGTQLFAGALKNKCVSIPNNSTFNFDDSVKNRSNWLLVNGNPVICGNVSTARSCPVNYTCLPDIGNNPNYGYTNFDAFTWSLLSTVQLVTADYWENIYNHIIASTGFWSVFYFLMVIFFGTFYLLNLILAVVALSYQQEITNKESGQSLREISSSYSFHMTFKPQPLYPNMASKVVINWFSFHFNKRTSPESPLEAISPGPHCSSSCDCTTQLEHGRTTRDTTTLSPLPETSSMSTSSFEKENQTKSLSSETQESSQSSYHENIKETCSVESSYAMKTYSNIQAPFNFQKYRHFSRKSVPAALAEIPHTAGLIMCSSYCLYISPNTSLIRRKCLMMVTSPIFDWFVLGVILLNTIVMAVEYHGMDETFLNVLNMINMVCTFVFIMEFVTKVAALSLRCYIKSRWNILDGFVVIISLVELAIVWFVPKISYGLGFGVFRTLRLLRVLKLAQSWVTMRALLSIISASLGQLGNLTLLLMIVIYTFAVIGMQIFSGCYTPQHFEQRVVPRWNFTDFLHSFMMIFRVLCGEWIEPLITTMHLTSPAAIIFYFAVLIIGNFLILNLFLALLLSSFSTESLKSDEYKRPENTTFPLRQLVKKYLNLSRLFPSTYESGKTRRQSTFDKIGVKQDDNLHEIPKTIDVHSSDQSNREKESCDTPHTSSSRSRANCDVELAVPDCLPQLCHSCPRYKINPDSIVYKAIMLCRAKVLAVVENKHFDTFILFIIFISSVSLAFEDVHLDSRPRLKNILKIINYITTTIFVLEFCLKIFGFGVFQYFRDVWNCLDFFIAVISIFSLIGSNLSSFRALRTLRALRPLRAISRWHGMKIVVNSLFAVIPEIFNVCLVCAVFWLIFSVMGVQFFGGRFYKCVDENGEKLAASIVTDKTKCLSMNYKWRNSKINFDNSFAGFIALFQVATFEGWMEIMADAADVTEVDKQPIRNRNHLAPLYFVVFIVFGSFFVLNLFVGVTVENFNRLKKHYESGAVNLFLTDTQRAWYETLRKAANKKPRKVEKRPVEYWRGRMFDLIKSPKFEWMIFVFILLNLIVLTLKHHGQSETITSLLKFSNLAFTVVFFLEAALRIFAQRMEYFKDAWNVFDFAILTFSVAALIMEALSQSFIITPTIFRVARVFRVGRLLRFYTNMRGVRRLLITLLISLPALVNIGALLFLIIFIYAIIGMSMFSHVKHTGAVDDMVNFETFLNSILLLFRLSTSAGWNDVLEPLMIQPPDCDLSHKDLPNGNCGLPSFAVSYFVSFVLITSLIIVNMYIAIIMENLHEACRAENTGLTEEDLDMFYKKWEIYDPRATQYIPHSHLSDFVDSLDEPIRISKPNKYACINLHIPIHQGDRIHCVDVIQALVHRLLGDIENDDAEMFSYIQTKVEEAFLAAFPNRATQLTRTTTFERNQENYAAQIIQKAWRGRMKRNEDSKRKSCPS